MIYAGRIQNQQYSQYANRAAGYKPDYAGITKAAALANDRLYREMERRKHRSRRKEST